MSLIYTKVTLWLFFILEYPSIITEQRFKKAALIIDGLLCGFNRLHCCVLLLQSDHMVDSFNSGSYYRPFMSINTTKGRAE